MWMELRSSLALLRVYRLLHWVDALLAFVNSLRLLHWVDSLIAFVYRLEDLHVRTFHIFAAQSDTMSWYMAHLWSLSWSRHAIALFRLNSVRIAHVINLFRGSHFLVLQFTSSQLVFTDLRVYLLSSVSAALTVLELVGRHGGIAHGHPQKLVVPTLVRLCDIVTRRLTLSDALLAQLPPLVWPCWQAGIYLEIFDDLLKVLLRGYLRAFLDVSLSFRFRFDRFLGVVDVNNYIIRVDSCRRTLWASLTAFVLASEVKLRNCVDFTNSTAWSATLSVSGLGRVLPFFTGCHDHSQCIQRTRMDKTHQTILGFETSTHNLTSVIVWTEAWVSIRIIFRDIFYFLSYANQFNKNLVQLFAGNAKHWWIMLANFKFYKFLNEMVHLSEHLEFNWMHVLLFDL